MATTPQQSSMSDLRKVIGAVVITVIGGVILLVIQYRSGVFEPIPLPPVRGEAQLFGTPTKAGERQTFNVSLAQGEVIVGHADEFQDQKRCVAFLIVGPVQSSFGMRNGIYYRYTNVSPQSHNAMLVDQRGILINKYNCPPGEVKEYR